MISNVIKEAIILAGGTGSRLSPFTKHRPKPLVPIANYTMLDWNLLMLASNGIQRVIVVIKYLGHQIKEHIEKVSKKNHPNLEIIVPEVNSIGTADAVRRVSKYIISENFIVTMADIVTNLEIKKMIIYHIRKGGIATVALKSLSESPNHFGVVFIDEKMKVKHFLEKPKGSELQLTKLVMDRNLFNSRVNLINSGVYCFNRKILELLDLFPQLIDFGKHTFPFLLKNKFLVFGFKNKEDFYWKDCGHPEQLLWSNLDIINNLNYPYVPKGVKVNGSWFGKNVKLAKNVVFSSIAVGNDVKIENYSTIHKSSIDDKSMVGQNCTIENSSIWENVIIGDNTIIRNSIIADQTVIGNNCIIEDKTFIIKGSYIRSGTHIKNNFYNKSMRNVVGPKVGVVKII